ncbi:MAG: hypothetical protein KJ949_01545 [Nanoarchaeota archaeon]|nr:hypothetical protein [Nanoarchaeota archaeon]MBU4308464.1 hypothetical protein [Nanoarchaeota archaeon]
MTKENLIHVKINYEEAVDSKKEILSLQMNLLKVLRAIKNFGYLRTDELNQKTNFSKKIKSIKSDISKIQILLPKSEVPEKYKKKPEIKHREIKEKLIEKRESEDDLDMQLREIQEKLRAIGG